VGSGGKVTKIVVTVMTCTTYQWQFLLKLICVCNNLLTSTGHGLTDRNWRAQKYINSYCWMPDGAISLPVKVTYADSPFWHSTDTMQKRIKFEL